MERIADLVLVKRTYEPDDIGQQIETEVERDPVACTVHGITRAEWTAAGQQGLQPTCMCKLADSDDYEDEKIAVLNGVRYSIYRNYPTDDGGIELYLRQDAGDV